MQETDFDYEVIVGDDCSADNTRSIVQDLERRDPKIISAFLPHSNLGSYGGAIFLAMCRASRGEHIAVLDGDDYWTSPRKLQRQADFLDAHPECTACFHDVLRVDEDGGSLPRGVAPTTKKDTLTMEDILRGNPIPTCSTMFRRYVIDDAPPWYLELLQADWSLHLMCARLGNIGYIDEVMAAYRVHRGGVFSSLDEVARLEAVLGWRERIVDWVDGQYRQLMTASIVGCYYKLARLYGEKGDLARARAYFRRFVLVSLIYRQVWLRTILGLGLKLYAGRSLGRPHRDIQSTLIDR
jgi:glycosyltransferase involved in cell wall biosynthesis